MQCPSFLSSKILHVKLVNVTSALAGNVPHYVGTSSRIVYKLIPHLVSLKDLGSCGDQGGKNLVLNCEIVSCDVRKEESFRRRSVMKENFFSSDMSSVIQLRKRSI